MNKHAPKSFLRAVYHTVFSHFFKKIWALEATVQELEQYVCDCECLTEKKQLQVLALTAQLQQSTSHNRSLGTELHITNLQLQAHRNLLQFNREHYLNLLHNCLVGLIYEDAPLATLGQKDYDPTLREYGWDWPSKAHTMIGSKRLTNVRQLVESALGNKVPGDLIETGVWRGGACIMMRAVLAAYGIHDRKVWLADSFCGLPAPDVENYPLDKDETFHQYDELAVTMEAVQENFRRYGLLDDQVKFLKGWFKDTLPQAPIERIAVLRLDGDLYESTIQPLDALYDKVSDNGFIIVDDYHVVKGCRHAVHDFWAKRGLSPELQEIDGVGVFWKKAACTASGNTNQE